MVDISPGDAQKLGVCQGDRVALVSPWGRVQVKVNVTHKAEAGVVCLYQDYPEADVNLLTDSERLDPYSGFPCFRETIIRIEKV